jgi:DNA invertase Pin-like site-specific DNA recombinase
MASVAQRERRAIGQRTRYALAVKKGQGVTLGRPKAVSPAVVKRIARLRRKGLAYRAIADDLNERGVLTAHGGRQWYPPTVRVVLSQTST